MTVTWLLFVLDKQKRRITIHFVLLKKKQFKSWSSFVTRCDSTLAWRIPGTGEPGGLPSLGSHRVVHDRRDLAAAAVTAPPDQRLKAVIRTHIYKAADSWHSIFHNVFCCCCWVSQACLNLGDPVDCSPPGSAVHEISQARILEWVASSFSKGSYWSRDQTHVSCLAGGFFTTLPLGTPVLYLR